MYSVRNRRFGRGTVWALLALGLALPAASLAALGDDVGSIERDRAAMKGTLRVTPQITYDVHEITLPSGRVREYIAAGHVFAVAWDGHTNPDLTQLLGTHVETFHALVKPQPGNHHVVSIRTNDMIISLRQLPRGMEGHVIVPSLLPAGIAPAALR